jgi:hypothetical protein
MIEKIQERITNNLCVVYKVMSNLDEIPIKGIVKFVRKQLDLLQPDDRQGDYESEVIENPTWLDICALANEMIIVMGDPFQRTLVNVEVVDHDGDVQIANFVMES